VALQEADTWQDIYILELLSLIQRITAAIDECPEMWPVLERAGISLRERIIP
jgi:hypothetical protein